VSPAAEFSRPCTVERLSSDWQTYRLEANASEREALARRFELPSLDALCGTLQVRSLAEQGLIEIEGRVIATLSQTCTVTLEPVPEEVDAAFRRMFTLAPAAPSAEVELDPEAEEPEPLPAGGLDLGEILAEELAMALDPHPRAADADATLASVAMPDTAEEESPFSRLASLRRS
jgi:uncharacterized metal-binding protein YceD (DUF177 family)